MRKKSLIVRMIPLKNIRNRLDPHSENEPTPRDQVSSHQL